MSALKNLLQKIDEANRDWRLIQKNDSVVAAISGGPDSAALLFALSKLCRKYSLRLSAAHLDHGLQGLRSRFFLDQAKKLSQKLEVPFYSKTVKVAVLAKKYKRSLEEMGRLERYRFFLEVAAKSRSNKIATAHTLDDQAETVLLRLVRGSGLRGLCGVASKRREGGVWIIRPLLLCQKKELLAALKENRISFSEDPTNRDDSFTRNRVRRRLLPLLESAFNPRIKEALSGLQSASWEAQDFIEKKASAAFKNCAVKKISRGKASLKLNALKRLHRAVRSEVFSQALFQVKGDLKRFTYRNLSGLEALLDSSEAGLKLHLPGVHVQKTDSTLDFSRSD